MIKFLSSWAEQLTIAVIVAVLIEMIIPNNKTKKYINMVIGIYVLFNIISPFINNSDVLSFNNIDFNEYANISANTNINQTSMDVRLEELYIEQLEKDVISKVKENGYTASKCIVEANLDENAKDKGINKIEIVISGRKQNSNIETVNTIEEVEINVGNKEKESSNNITNEELKSLKKVLSDYYEVKEEVIKITS